MLLGVRTVLAAECQLGSGSDTVRAPWLPPFGPATKVNARRSVAQRSFDRQVRQMARASLRYQPVVLSDAQVAAIGRGVTDEIQRFQPATIHAFAHLRAHFHFVCGPCRYDIRRFAGRLKGAGTRQRMAEGLHPMAKYADAAGHVPSMWSVKPWWCTCLMTRTCGDRFSMCTTSSSARKCGRKTGRS